MESSKYFGLRSNKYMALGYSINKYFYSNYCSSTNSNSNNKLYHNNLHYHSKCDSWNIFWSNIINLRTSNCCHITKHSYSSNSSNYSFRSYSKWSALKARRSAPKGSRWNLHLTNSYNNKCLEDIGICTFSLDCHIGSSYSIIMLFIVEIKKETLTIGLDN